MPGHRRIILLAPALLPIVPAVAWAQAADLDVSNPSGLGLILWIAGLVAAVQLARSRSTAAARRKRVLTAAVGYPVLTAVLFVGVILLTVVLVRMQVFTSAAAGRAFLWVMKMSTIALSAHLAAGPRPALVTVESTSEQPTSAQRQ
jgi:hypothetical protein